MFVCFSFQFDENIQRRARNVCVILSVRYSCNGMLVCIKVTQRTTTYRACSPSKSFLLFSPTRVVNAKFWNCIRSFFKRREQFTRSYHGDCRPRRCNQFCKHRLPRALCLTGWINRCGCKSKIQPWVMPDGGLNHTEEHFGAATDI